MANTATPANPSTRRPLRRSPRLRRHVRAARPCRPRCASAVSAAAVGDGGGNAVGDDDLGGPLPPGGCRCPSCTRESVTENDASSAEPASICADRPRSATAPRPRGRSGDHRRAGLVPLNQGSASPWLHLREGPKLGSTRRALRLGARLVGREGGPLARSVRLEPRQRLQAVARAAAAVSPRESRGRQGSSPCSMANTVTPARVR